MLYIQEPGGTVGPLGDVEQLASHGKFIDLQWCAFDSLIAAVSAVLAL